MQDGKNKRIDYNVGMSPKEEKSLTNRRKARYFLTVMAVYMAVYFVLYLILSLIHAMIYLNPYLRMVVLLVWFIAAAYITERVMKLEAITSFIEIP